MFLDVLSFRNYQVFSSPRGAECPLNPVLPFEVLETTHKTMQPKERNVGVRPKVLRGGEKANQELRKSRFAWRPLPREEEIRLWALQRGDCKRFRPV